MLLPPSLRDWVPEDHLVHSVIDAVERLDLRCARVNERGSGSEQYPPAALLALLVYSYPTGKDGQPSGLTVLAAVKPKHHGRTGEQLEARHDPLPPPDDAPILEQAKPAVGGAPGHADFPWWRVSP